MKNLTVVASVVALIGVCGGETVVAAELRVPADFKSIQVAVDASSNEKTKGPSTYYGS